MANKIIVGISLVLGVLGTVLGFGGLHSHTAPASFGGTETNPAWFAGGLAWGAVDSSNNTAQVVIPAGSNQANFNNTLGRDIVVDSADVSINGTASSTYKVWVGTTTSATVTDQFNTTTAPFWSQLIDGFSIATSTGIQTGASSAYLTDNILSHKSSYPGKLQVPAGENVHVQFNNGCVVSGGCETATSTNRGFTNMTVTLWYHYRGND